MPTKGNLGQDPNSQESARSTQSYTSNLVVIPVEEGINPAQITLSDNPQIQDYVLITTPEGITYKATVGALGGDISGALSIFVRSPDDTIQQMAPSSYDPITRQMYLQINSIPPGEATTTKPGIVTLATQQQVLDADPLANKEAVTPSLMNFQQQGAGAVLYPLIKKMRESVSILDFGAVGDGETDCYDAFMAAIDSRSFGSWVYFSGGTIEIPLGNFYVSKTINLKKQIKFVGCAGAYGYSVGSTITFAAGQHGFIVHSYNTVESGTESTPTGSGGGSVFEGLLITNKSNTVGATYGIWMRGGAVIRDCYVSGFSSHNIYINAGAGGGGLIEGNANNWYIEHTRSAFSGGNGIHIQGADANAGNGIALDCANNVGYGIADYSFLGNTYSGCHSADNGTSTTKRAQVNYGGRIYLCINATLGSTTTPGTNGAVWFDWAATAGADTWVYGNTYVQGGAYAGIGASARNLFTNCYSESGQPPSYFSGSSQSIFGGLHAAGIANAYAFSGDSGGFGAYNLRTNILDISSVKPTGPNGFSIMNIKTVDSFYPWNFNASTPDGGLYLTNGGLTNRQVYQITGPATTVTFGRSSPMPFVFAPTTTVIGSSRVHSYAASKPTTGEHAAGEVCWNLTPTPGGPPGWSCISSGVPGVWAPMPSLGYVLNWTSMTMPSSSNWLSVAFGNGVFLAVGTGGKSATSTNGIIWTDRGMATLSSPRVSFGGGVFLIVDIDTVSSTVYSTADGITYTPRTMPSSAKWNITYVSGSTFLATNNNSGCAVSTNVGSSWAAVTDLPVAATNYIHIASNGSRVCAVSPTGNVAYTDDLGSSWGIGSMSGLGGIYSFFYSGGVFCACAAQTYTFVNTSTDGITFSNTYPGGGSFAGGGGSSTVSVLMANAQQSARYSQNNGQDWVASGPNSISQSYTSVAFGAGVFVAVAGGTSSATGMYGTLTN